MREEMLLLWFRRCEHKLEHFNLHQNWIWCLSVCLRICVCVCVWLQSAMRLSADVIEAQSIFRKMRKKIVSS